MSFADRSQVAITQAAISVAPQGRTEAVAHRFAAAWVDAFGWARTADHPWPPTPPGPEAPFAEPLPRLRARTAARLKQARILVLPGSAEIEASNAQALLRLGLEVTPKAKPNAGPVASSRETILILGPGCLGTTRTDLLGQLAFARQLTGADPAATIVLVRRETGATGALRLEPRKLAELIAHLEKTLDQMPPEPVQPSRGDDGPAM